jgi:NADPH2:quinone reductase
MTVRAVQAVAFGGPDVLEVVDLPEPDPDPGHVIVAVSIAPVLFLDTQIRAGLGRGWFPVTPPYVPGAGVAGTVSSVGAGADGNWTGRRVVADTVSGWGGYAERVAVAADGLVEVPEGQSLTTAAALLHDGRTAIGLVEATEPRPDEWVLVIGAAGGLGALLVQLARNLGARVIGAARGERKLALARDLGAEVTVDYAGPDWASQVLAVTGGTGPGVVLDGIGGEIGRAAYQVTARGGRFSAHGTPGGGFAPIGPHDAEQRGITVWGIDRVQFGPAEGARLTSQALAQAVSGQIKPLIGQAFPLERAADAHRAVESRNAVGKTLLEV